MARINPLAKAYASKGVVVLGMNTDEKQEDATFVIDKMHLAYDSLKTPNELPAKYAVRGFPTLVVIDQQGIVRHLHVGYSPTLRKDLGEILDNLLKKDFQKTE